MAFDYKKEYKEFYMPKGTPSIITVPKMNYIAIRGSGNPNDEDGEYKQAMRPGMREIGMANTELGIDNTFLDIAKLEKQCKFSDCQHDTEPGCAVKAAIESGDLSVDRYILYKSLSSENTRNYAKKKEISKWAKAAKKKRDSF